MSLVNIPVSELRKRKLFVATPMYGGQCAGAYTRASLDLVALAHKYGVEVQFNFLFNESLITRARNYLVAEFLRSSATHLMFIDSDISYNPMDVLALAALDRPIIGGPYPKKTIAWEKVFDAARFGLAENNPAALEQFSGDYVFNYAPGTKEIRLDQPVEVLELGTGFMMVKREVFEQFAEAYPERLYTPDHNRSEHFDGSKQIHAFFDTVIDPVTRRYLSEDYMFCQWSRNIGIPVFLCPWMKMQHIGMYIYGGTMEALATLSHAQQHHQSATPVSKTADV